MSSTSAASLAAFAPLVRWLGGDPVVLVREVGLPERALEDTSILVSLDEAARVMDLAAERLDCPDFGLRASELERQQVSAGMASSFGPIAVAIRNSGSMQEALETASRYLGLHSPGAEITLEPDPYDVRGVVGLRHSWTDLLPRHVQMLDRTLLNLHSWVATLGGEDYGLRSVEIGYRPSAGVERLESAFGGVRVNVDRPRSLLRIPRALLDQPIEDADESLRTVALFYLDEQQVPAGSFTVTRTRAAIRALLGNGTVSVGSVARALEVAPRTLQHRLAREGSSFGAVLDEVRREEALLHLRRPDRSMSDVAALLDMANQAALSRAARRWWDMTPTQKRASLRVARNDKDGCAI